MPERRRRRGGRQEGQVLPAGAESKKAHGPIGICTGRRSPVKVKVTGDVEEKDGKKVIDATKIEKAE